MKLAEVRTKDDEALQKQLGESREELLKLRFQLATGALENSSRIKQVKREIAQLLTVLNSRRIEDGATATPAPAAKAAKAAPADDQAEASADADAASDTEDSDDADS